LLWGQVISIPGLAIVLALLIHGCQNCGSRLVTLLIASAVVGPALFISFVAVVVVVALAIDSANSIMSLLLSVFALGLTTVAFLGIRHLAKILGKRNVQLESETWLAERRSGSHSAEPRRRQRGLRVAVWIPSLTVLSVLLFLPETWGLVSHIIEPGRTKLAGYSFSVPSTWITLARVDRPVEGWQMVSGMAGRGLGFGVGPYLHGPLPWSSWYIRKAAKEDTRIQSYRHEHFPEVSRRHVVVGQENLECVEYHIPVHFGLGSSPETPTSIDCTSEKLYADFFGNPLHVEHFYRMLEGMTPPPSAR
jgi:hypothetical protein